MSRPRVLLISIGFYGQKYLSEMTEHDTGADIAGIVEPAPDVRERFPVIDQLEIPVYPGVEDFYREQSADLAVISAPIHLHAELTIACMRHGSHVLCEKPLCLTREDALRMDACSKETGRFLAIGYQLNYQQDVLALKRDILAGRFGAPKRIRVVHAMRRGAAYYARNNWAGRISVNGREVFDNPFTNACAHNFQLVCFLLGPDMASACGIKGVDAELYRGNPRLENLDIAFLRFHTDVGASVLYSTAHPLRTKALGPIGVMEFEHAAVTWQPGQRYLARLEDGTCIDYGQLPPTNPMQKLYDAIACVREGGSPVCTVAAELSHIDAVRMTQSQPITDVDPAHVEVVTEGGDTFWCVRSLEDTLLRASEAWALPRELGLTL
ncbi:MAG: Gfo/Idh/MocA family protein [Aristaeellaceae bacterium]